MSKEKVCSSWVSCVMLCIALITLGPYAGTVQAEGVGSTQVIIVGSGGDRMPQNLQQAPQMRRLFLPESLKNTLPVEAAMRASDAIGYVPDGMTNTQYGNMIIAPATPSVSQTTLIHNSDFTVGEGDTMITGFSAVTSRVNVGTDFDVLLSDIDGDYRLQGSAYSNNGRLELDGTLTGADGTETPFTYLMNDDGTFENIGGGQGLDGASGSFSSVFHGPSTGSSTGVKKNRSFADRTNAFNGDDVQFLAVEGALVLVIVVVLIIAAVCAIATWLVWFTCDATKTNEYRGRDTLWKNNKLRNHWESVSVVC